MRNSFAFILIIGFLFYVPAVLIVQQVARAQDQGELAVEKSCAKWLQYQKDAEKHRWLDGYRVGLCFWRAGGD
jgi:hypothetical protein